MSNHEPAPDTHHRWRLAAALVVVLGVLGFAIAVAPTSGAAAQSVICPETQERVFNQGGEAGALCRTDGPDDLPPSEASQEQLWNRYCTDYENITETYTYVDGAEVTFNSWSTLSETRVEQLNLNPTGVYGSFRARCEHPVRSGQGGTFYYTITDPISIDDLLAEVKERIEIDDPSIDSNPSFTERFAVVRIPTWLWVDEAYWEQENLEEETRGFVTVQVWAEPEDLEWGFTGGDPEIDCPNGPGTPWAPGAGDPDCSVLFRQSSAGQVDDAFGGEATVSWQFYWTLNGADQGPFDELLELTTDFEIQVGEIQAVEN